MNKRMLFPITLATVGMLFAACGVSLDPTPTPTKSPASTPTPTPQVAGFDALCVSTEAYATEPIKVVIGKGKVPTALDSINTGGCDFTKPVVRMTIELDGPGGKQTAEIPFASPLTNVGFPLSDEIEIPLVLASLTPGEYTRVVTAYTADGESKELGGFLPVRLVEADQVAQSNLDDAKALWQFAGINSYRYTVQWQCFCIMEYVAPMVVEVRDGQVVSVAFADAGQTGEIPSPERFGTMDRIFGYVQDAIDQNAARITAEYDAGLGHPTNVFIDDNELTIDEEQGFAITLFETL